MQVREHLSQNRSPQDLPIIAQGKGERRWMLLQVSRMKDVAASGLWASDLLALTRVPCVNPPPAECRRARRVWTLWSGQ